jgi:hypothetical protein
MSGDVEKHLEGKKVQLKTSKTLTMVDQKSLHFIW